jgi:Zinc knuckle
VKDDKDVPFPEMRPEKGRTPIKGYMNAERQPWYVPGMENVRRIAYPVGWDKVLKGAASQMPQESQLRPVVLPARAGPSVGLQSGEEPDSELAEARRNLERAKELARLRAETQRIFQGLKDSPQIEMPVKAEKSEKVEKVEKADKAEKISLKNVGQQKPVGQAHHGPQWNIVAGSNQQKKTGPLESKNPPVGDEGRTLAASNATKVSLTAEELLGIRRKELFGFPAKVEVQNYTVRVGGSRKVEKKTVLIVEMFESLRKEFLVTAEITKAVQRVTRCKFEFPPKRTHQTTCILHIVGESLDKELAAEEMMLTHIEKVNEAAAKRYASVKHSQQKAICNICKKPANHPWQVCPEVTCYSCNGKGHIAQDCMKKKSSEGAYCRNCSRHGHTIFDCTMRGGGGYKTPQPVNGDEKTGKGYLNGYYESYVNADKFLEDLNDERAGTEPLAKKPRIA